MFLEPSSNTTNSFTPAYVYNWTALQILPQKTEFALLDCMYMVNFLCVYSPWPLVAPIGVHRPLGGHVSKNLEPAPHTHDAVGLRILITRVN